MAFWTVGRLTLCWLAKSRPEGSSPFHPSCLICDSIPSARCSKTAFFSNFGVGIGCYIIDTGFIGMMIRIKSDKAIGIVDCFIVQI